jgi:hypothetical protein
MTGDINGFLVIGALWFVLTLITRAKGSVRPRRPGPPSYPRPTPVPSRQDPTQQEGVRLQRMLGDLRRALEEAAQASSTSDGPLARSRQAKSESLEPSEVLSLEAEREPVDLDDEAAGIEARRIQAAADRNAGRKIEVKQPAALVRQEPADHTSAPRYSARQLREAVVWREILDPPLGLRDDREG